MANSEHLSILKMGIQEWDEWRKAHPEIRPDLSEVDLSSMDLRGANLSHVDFYKTVLQETDFRGANLREAYLSHAILDRAQLNGAELYKTILVETSMEGTDLSGAYIYGAAVWNVKLTGAIQNNLIITRQNEPAITVDSLEVAQFIYLLMNNPKIREVIDTVAKKAVLILGRFTTERKAILDALKEELHSYGYVPILFDFDKPSSQDLTETVSTLAHLSRFILVDLTDPSSAPYEVGTIAPDHIRPIQALFQPSAEAQRVFAMFQDLMRRYHWVLPPFEYQDREQLLTSLPTNVIGPAEQKARELSLP